VGVVATITGVPDGFPETQKAVAALEAWFATQPEAQVLSLVAKGAIAAGVALVLKQTLADDLRNSMRHRSTTSYSPPKAQLKAPW
jgi:hypothetical protein